MKPDFSLSDNWEYIGEVEGYQQVEPSGKIIFIPPLNFPLTIHDPALAITVSHDPNPSSTWRFAGSVSVSMRTGVLIGGNLDSVITTKKLWLNQVNLVIFSDLAADFKLVFYPPKWFLGVNYSVHRYIGGGVPDYESKLNQIYQAVTNN